MITSLIEMLQLPNFGHMTTLQSNSSREIKFRWWRDDLKLWRHNLCFKIPLLLEDLEAQKKLKELKKYVLNCNLCLYFLILQKLLTSVENMQCQQNSRGVSRDSLGKVCGNYCSKFHHYRIYGIDFREGGSFCTPINKQPHKGPSSI